MEIIIRPAVAVDLPSILEIVNHAILHTTSNYNYEPQSIETQMRWFEDKQAHHFPIIVAEYEGIVIGYGAYGTFREKIGYQHTVEHSVYVRATFVGKGVGKMLLTHLIQLARASGIRTIIGAIDASNQDSIDFHKKFGFTSCGIVKDAAFKFDRWLDLLFMQLILK